MPSIILNVYSTDVDFASYIIQQKLYMYLQNSKVSQLWNGTKYIDHLDSKQANYINKYKKEIRPAYYHHHHHLAINCTCITFKRRYIEFLYALTYWLFTGTCNYVVTFNFRLIEYYLKLKGFTLPFKDQTLLNRTKY